MADTLAVQREGESARVIVRAGGQERTIVLGERLCVGRSPQGELVIEELRASRSHAQILDIGQGRYQIRDLGSLNGTFVNGQRIRGSRDLFHGDEIRIGGTVIRFVAPDQTRAAQLEADPLQMRAAPAAAAQDGEAELLPGLLVVLAIGIRSYGSLAEKLPREPLREFVSQWQIALAEQVRTHGGRVEDAGEGDASIAYWSVEGDPSLAVQSALGAARELLRCATAFEAVFRERFEIGFFEIGIGAHLGAGAVPAGSAAARGEAVAVASFLADLTKDKGYAVLASWDAARCVDRRWVFRNLGEGELGGVAVPILALDLDA